MSAPDADKRVEAVRFEAELATRAVDIRGNAEELTPELFVRLWPLLREPIPEGFIKSVGIVTGKPYASTGISSVQVQIDRMNNVLTPMWWRDHVEYLDDGKVAHVEVHVGNVGGKALIFREAWGGVDRGSTKGNVYKGSYTNAAKLAFARVGPGHEVYLGVTDLDPDVDEKIAAEQAKTSDGSPAASDKLLSEDGRERVLKHIKEDGHDIAELLQRVGVEDAANLTVAHAYQLREILDLGKPLTEQQRAGLAKEFDAAGVQLDLVLTAMSIDGIDSITDEQIQLVRDKLGEIVKRRDGQKDEAQGEAGDEH